MGTGLAAVLLAGGATLALAALPSEGSATRGPLPEYSVKAAFLYRFLEFVEWPRASPLPAGTVTIGVLGQDPFGEVLDRAILGKVAAGRSLTIRRFPTLESLSPCAVLFISSSETKHLPDILARLEGVAVLTVGEGDQFARRGGMIGFYFEDNRVRLEINRTAAERAGLRVSSKLLAVARLVQTETADAGRER
ncbi:MAG TPA: YfiR family protein [Vicinamibacteria bacterium]